MASLIREKDGRRRIQFYDGNRKRRSIGLGTLTDRNAERIRDKVEQLVEHTVMGTPPDSDVSRWIAGLDDRMHSKLVKAGLTEARILAVEVEPELSELLSLKQFLADYFERRTDIKKSSLTVYGHVRRNLLAFFEPDTALVEFTTGHAVDFGRYLKQDGLASTTIDRRISLARTIFEDAVRHRVIPANPFFDIRKPLKSIMSRNNKSRQRFIERTTIDRVMDFASDAEWRLLIVLARYGGLRVPSEPLSLRWCDVGWQRKRILVTAPKTEHHEDKGTRWIPMFPELVEPLRDVYEQAEDGSEFVIVKNRPASLRDSAGNWQNANLRTQFARIIRRAGLEPWPKLWQNLRSTRETELTGPGHNHPLHVVTAWLGNTEAVAREHYLQITDDDFERATTPEQLTAPIDKTVRKPVRYGLEPARTNPHAEKGNSPNSSQRKEKRPHAETCDRSEWRIGDSK